jgi:YbbR domain-containing protein
MIEFFRNVFLRDFWLKLFSLALAILIWVTVSLGRSGTVGIFFSNRNLNQQTYVNVPVSVVCPAADLRDFKVNPTEVDITVQGEAGLLRDLRPKDIQAAVDLRGIESGGLRKRVDVSVPPGVTFVRVVPDEVEVTAPPKR